MTQDDLMTEIMILGADDAETEATLMAYEVVIEVPSEAIGDPHLGIKTVRWEHHDRRIVLEAKTI
jgi:hypothetical protein